MGSLHNFNQECKSLGALKQKYDLNVFVETGCFRGNTLRFMTQFGFDRMYSCDVDIEMINLCKDISSNLELFHGTSVEFLESILPGLNSDRILFFLDAHLPEHDKNNGGKIIETDLNFPLEQEIQIIDKYRNDKQDVIVCDDLRIYEDGPFEGGNWETRKQFGKLDLDFLKSHNYDVRRFYSQEGYILLTKEL